MLVLRSPREDTRNPEAIAEIIGVSLTTVRTHPSDLFRKTETARQAELVARAVPCLSAARRRHDTVTGASFV
jgi:FixJ family two-component response regulator